ncbi:MAG: hypothetical protein R2769_14370 [Saprospiraceae bacterium]
MSKISFQHFALAVLSAAFIYTITLQSCKTDGEVISQTDLKPLVNPPIPQLDPSFGTFSFEAETGWEMNLPSGTRIKVSPNALIDSSGFPVKGQVDIMYREFHDAISVFLAGIPMEYQDGHFTTAGSFEIRASQKGTPVYVKSEKPIEVRLASLTAGNDYDFFFLDEDKRGWDSLGTREAEVNIEKVALKKKIRNMYPELPFPLNRNYFAFNYQAVLDIAYPNNRWNQSDSVKESLTSKCKQYGLGWEKAEVWESITFGGKKENAALMVWKNLKKKPFPKWADHQYGKIEPFGKNRYRYKMVNGQDTTQKFEVDIEAVMPLTMLFAYPPEKWKRDYDKIMRQIEIEEERLATLAEVYRTFEVANFGIYNWDKLMKEQSLLVAGTFDWNMKINDTLSELTVICITPDNNGIINFPRAAWKQMAIPLEKNARLFCVLPGNKIGIFDAKKYNRIPFDEMEKEMNPAYVFDMEPKSLEPFSEGGFRKIVGLAGD